MIYALCIICFLIFLGLFNSLYQKYKALQQSKTAEYDFELKEWVKKIEERKKELNEKDEKLEERKLYADELNSQIDKRVEQQFQIESQKLQTLMEGVKRIAQEDQQNLLDDLEAARQEGLNKLAAIQDELYNYQQKQNEINNEIIRRRQIAEQQDFYRIVLTAETLEDIEIIQSIRQKLNKREFLDKMLYDNYISKPVKEMCKRVLGGKDPTGIYKITNIQTNESYIGKSTTVASRWQNHIKSACGLDGVADSQFQRALRKYGIENWTFELLETTTKDKLTEREKFYIQFYNTIEYGYNQRVG